MSEFKVVEPIFPPQSWEERMTERQWKWLEWIADQAEEVKRFPSWKTTQSNFRLNFPAEGEAPSDKTLKRLITKVLRDQGKGKWIDGS